jgi:hypothetical protein
MPALYRFLVLASEASSDMLQKNPQSKGFSLIYEKLPIFG